MRKIFLFLCFVLLSLGKTAAQEVDIKPYLDAWSVSDTSQTHLAEKTYEELKPKNNFKGFQLKIKALYNWLESHPDDRLKVRILMYDILGRLEYSRQITRRDYDLLAKAIGTAHRLKDNQLKAELYAFYAQLNFGGPEDFLLYNLKAVELQRKVGFQHFSYVQNRFFNISYALFHIKNYKQSISYGKECLTFKNVEVKKWDPRVYIFQLDMIGASYLKTAQYDSAKYFYGQIIDTLQKKPDQLPRVQRLWLSIAKGNIGHALIMQGHEKEGISMVQEQLKVGLDPDQSNINNAAIAQNVLAGLEYRHGNYALANKKWREALRYAITSNEEEQKVIALKGIAMSYSKLNRADSSLKYYDNYEQLRDRQKSEINAKELNRLNSQMAFDNLQNSYAETSYKLGREKLTRNFILIGIGLLAIIVFLIYNRDAIRAKYRREELIRKQQETERQMLEAREQVIAFSRNILEKDRLIYSLTKSLKSHSTLAEEKENTSALVSYVLVTDREWVKFREMVSNAYPGFFIRLEEAISNITPAEERLASLICLQLNDRQMASMLGISKDSVGRSKRRLKQRITIPEGKTLEGFITELSR